MAQIPDLSWFISLCIAHTLALTGSVYRSWSKLKTRQVWWDEPFYVVATAFNLILFGGLFLARIHDSNQEPVSTAAYIVTLTSYFMVIWVTRAGVLMSLVRALASFADRVRADVIFTFILVLTGVAFSIGGTIYSLTKAQGVQRVPLPFVAVALACDIIADFYIAVTTYIFFMTTPLLLPLKIFSMVSFYGPLLATVITTTSWALSITIFSPNLRTHIYMLNISACCSVAMGGLPAIMRPIYNHLFPRTEESTPDPGDQPPLAFPYVNQHPGLSSVLTLTEVITDSSHSRSRSVPS